MSEFLVEVYVSRETAGTQMPTAHDVSIAAAQLTREGRRVRLLRSIFVPEDETCFYLFQAQTGDAVREAAMRAGLRFDRVREAVANWTEPAAPKPQQQGERS